MAKAVQKAAEKKSKLGQRQLFGGKHKAMEQIREEVEVAVNAIELDTQDRGQVSSAGLSILTLTFCLLVASTSNFFLCVICWM